MHPYRIYVYGNPRDVSLIRLFQKGLPDFGTVEYRGIERGKGARQFLLEEGEEWPQPGTDGGLLLFKKNFSIPAQVWPLPGWMSVITPNARAAGASGNRDSGDYLWRFDSGHAQYFQLGFPPMLY